MATPLSTSMHYVIGLPSTELLQNLASVLYMTTFDLRVMSHDATCVVNPCAKLQVDTTYHSSVRVKMYNAT